MSENDVKRKNMYLKGINFPPKILKAIALQVKGGYFPNAGELVRFAVRKFIYEVMDFSFWPPKIKNGPVIIEDIPSELEKERLNRAYDLMKTHGIKSANRKLREEFGMGISEKLLGLFDEEIRNNLKLTNEKNIGFVKEINHLAKEKLNPNPKTEIQLEKIESPEIKNKSTSKKGLNQEWNFNKKSKKKNKKLKRDQAWDLAKEGKSVDQIAELMKISEQTVYQHLNHKKKHLRIKKYPFTFQRKKKINPNLEKAWNLALEGKMMEDIAKIMDMKEKSIYTLLNNQRKKLGLSDYPFLLHKKKKKKKPLGNIYHPKSIEEKKLDVNSLFDEKGNLLVSTKIISKSTPEAVK